jgi:ABC-2 type transport system ATP-binding protein
MGQPALQIDNVSHDYGGRAALRDVSLSVPPGSVTVLLGPNGAGKSTLFSLVSRLLGLQHGDIRIQGRSLRNAGADALRPLGIVFQQPTLDLDLTVARNLRYFAQLHGIPAPVARKRIDAELARFGLQDRARDPVRKLNGGHRRRIEIARATLHDPAILLLDEPTVGLDIPTRSALVADLHARARDGLALLWATHLIDEVWPGDRLVVLHQGEVRASGTVEEVIAQAGAADLDGAFSKLTREQAAA